ncbi:MAG TPA: Gfo/Idh/MocA family oxidoreductase [Candidatus Brocadiia bacterium]|nr:Gfo/Idh/MocA family oxidoreductase [Candidatus Brocadiia bacterium]
MNKVGWAVLGCGAVGDWHCQAAQNAEHAELRAVCDAMADRAQATGVRFGVPGYGDLGEMLKRQDIQCVSICTPSGMHSDQGVACARHGKHVMTEKPIDITLEKTDALITACRAAGVRLSCIFQKRTSKAVQSARQAVQSGQLGKMVLGDAFNKWFRPQTYYDSGAWRGTWALDGGGCLINQGVHTIDALLWIMGDVKSVYAKADRLARKIEVEDTAVAVVQYMSGAFGVIEGATSVNPGEYSKLELHGEKGTIIIEDNDISKWAVGTDPNAPAENDDSRCNRAQKSGSASSPMAFSVVGHTIQIEDMALAILENRDPMVTGESARKSVELIRAIYESARTGKEVLLPHS